MEDDQDLKAKLEAAIAQGQHLREEIQQLKAILAQHSIPFPEPQNCDPTTTRYLPAPSEVAQIERIADKAHKIAAFRSLFRGREDIYAERWRTKDGTWAYRPAGKKNWLAVLASRPEEHKKVDRETRTLFALTDEVIRQHLTGKKTIGIYPLLLDETCWLLAADFDKKTWQEDSLAFLATCQRAGIAAYLERSRSGNGGHVWIFFETPVAAVLARKMGCALLTRTMERRHHLGLDSYDRFFPNQDTLPKGGFGNLIALPLQWMPRQNGNSLFVDDNLSPYPDQWKLLVSIRRVGTDQVEWIVNEATRKGQVMGVRLSMTTDDAEDAPWTLTPSRKRTDKSISGPFPESVEIVQSSLIFVPKSGLPEPMLNRIIRIAAFQNPEFYKAQAMRLPTWDKPRVICCSEEFAQHIALPRGCLEEVSALLKDHGIGISIRDERYSGKPIAVNFQGNLRDDQAEAVRLTLRHNEGVLCAPTAFGKTVVAAKLIAARGVNTLVLVHRQQLLEQWRARLAMFLDLPANAIGQIVGGKDQRKGSIDVALLQSLNRKGEVKDCVAEYGHVVVDECHHLTAFSFEQIMRQVKAKFIVGLTATPSRKDGHHPIIFMQCGPIRFNLSAREAAERSPFRHLMLPRPTGFRVSPEVTDLTIHDAYATLVTSEERNGQIVGDIVEAVREGRSPLVLTNRTDHIERLASALSDVQHVLVLKGGMGKKQRKAIAEQLASIPDGTPRVLLATGSYIGEGFDDSRLDTLFLTMPISWHGTLQQYVGRLHRIHDGKKVVRVFDYVDAQVPMLARMYEKRMKGYRAIGYEIEPFVAGGVIADNEKC
jgi:superfamily II DNA or RNA helicase